MAAFAIAFTAQGSHMQRRDDKGHRIDRKFDLNPTREKTPPHKIVIPKDLDAAMKEFDHMLSIPLQVEMAKGKEDDMIRYHFYTGMWVRNNWELWKGSKLSKWFNREGIFHPDDMSGILFTSYWRHLHKKPLEFGKQVAYYQEYWKKETGNKPPK